MRLHSLLLLSLVCTLALVSVTLLGGGKATAQSGYSVSASPSEVHVNAPITVSWSAPTDRPGSDLIGLYRLGQPDNTPVSTRSTGGASSGSVTFRINPINGISEQFEFRYVYGDYTRQAVSETVTVTNQYPTALDESFTVHRALGWGTHASVLANDSDPDGDAIALTPVGPFIGPSHGSITFNSNGDFAYIPTSGYVGPDIVTYRIRDEYGLYSTANINFNVVNRAPTARDDYYVVRGNLPWNGPQAGVMSNDFDLDGDPISFATPLTMSYTEHLGAVAFRVDGTFMYSPHPSYFGLDKFTYRICDDVGLCSNATMNFYVTGGDENLGDAPCAAVGHPVNVTNGNMYLHQTDYQLPGSGEAINLTRTFNSKSQRTGLFGWKWSSTYDEALDVLSDNIVRLRLADGRAIYFTDMTGTGSFSSATQDFHAQVTKNSDASFTLKLSDGRTHGFDAAGRLVSLTDRNNNQTTLSYANGRLASITDPFGRTLSVTSDANGRVLSLADGLGTIATYTYDGDQKLLTVTYADNSMYRFNYGYVHPNTVLKSVTDALGNILEAHLYDSEGRALTSERQGGVEKVKLNYISSEETDVTDALGHVTKYFYATGKGRNVVTRVEGSCGCGSSQVQTWTYDSQLNVTSKANALNQTTSYTYDAQGNRLTETDARGTITYTYNQFGEVLTVTDAMNGVTTNTYDAQGNLLSTKDALNNTTAYAYDARGQLTTITDARGKTTTLTWDASGRPAQVRDADNNTTSYSYDARSRLTGVTDAANRTISYEYDPAGRLKKITQPDLSYVTFTYDLAGRRTRVTDARNNSTTYAYDGAYRLTSETNAANKTTSYGYNLMSSLTSRTDALGRVTNYEYDDFNRLVKTIFPPATTGAVRLQETIAYDAAGNVTGRTDTAGRTTSYLYDAANRPTRATDAANQMRQYEYNARSNVTAVVDALGQRYTFAYDALGRVTQTTRGGVSMSYVYDSVGNRTQRTDYNGAVTSYTYDNLNRLAQIAYPDSTTATYAYDALSRLTGATNQNGTVTLAYDSRDRVQSVTDVFGRTISYAYDANNNRTSMSLGAVTGASYSYDALNRLTQVTDNTGASVTYGYDATNRLTTRTLPNGVATSYQYDGLDRLTRLQHTTTATTIADYQYQFDTASRITQTLEPTAERNYSYDQVDRLTAMTSPGLPNESYAYDSVGNRTASHLSASYGYQGFNKLASTATASYTYDNNGNLTAKTAAAGAWQYAWDDENRLKQVTRPDGVTVQYKYDALGRRVERTPSNGVATSFSYDGADVVLDASSDGSTVTYLNGPGIDHKLRQTSSTTGTLYFTQDHLGSTTALTDAGGNLVEREQYDAFGAGAASALTRYGYTGREWDADTGLYYYRARWYDPQQGRFISEDPIGFSGGDVNLYGYVWNNPQSFTDPTGHDGWGNDTADWLDERIEYARQFYQSGEQDWVWNGSINTGADLIFGFSDLFRVGSGVGHALYDCDDNAYGRAANVVMDVGRASGIFGLLASPFAGRVGSTTCFVAGTLVQTADGTKRIEEVQAGDVVLSADPSQSASSSQQPQRQEVTRTFTRTVSEVLDIHAGGETITATPEHPFWVVGAGWTAAGELRRGSALLTKGGIVIHVDSVERREGQFKVYNFEVGDTHTYYVSSLGVLVHNQCTPPISMDHAVELGAKHVGGQGTMGVSGSGGYQFVNTSIDGAGNTVTRISRFDINPASRHVQQTGPHLNLETHVNGRPVRSGPHADPHIPINPATIRPGDIP